MEGDILQELKSLATLDIVGSFSNIPSPYYQCGKGKHAFLPLLDTQPFLLSLERALRR